MRQNRDIPLGKRHRSTASIPRLQPTFSFRLPSSALSQIPEARSTGSKQTLNGLFIFITRVVTDTGPIYKIDPALFYPGEPEVYRWMLKNFTLTSNSRLRPVRP